MGLPLDASVVLLFAFGTIRRFPIATVW